MLSLALRYLVVVVVVGIGFGLLQGRDLLPRPGRPGAEDTRHPRVPARDAPRAQPAASLVVRADARGHFLLEAMVEGEPVLFLIDTGASDIVLGLDDAARLGMRPHALRFTRRYQTANGVIEAAGVTLRELRIGALSLYDVDASVTAAPLPVALLGTSFLERLAGYEVEGDRLRLFW